MSLWLGIALVVLALLGEPLFVVFGLAAMVLFAQGESPFFAATNDIFSDKFAGSSHLMTIPLFTLIGYTLAESGTPKRFVALARAWFGNVRGGLAIVCVLASTFFTMFTGGSGVTILALGGLLLPALVQERFSKRFSLGLVTTSGSLGLLFFPSLPLLLYSFLAANLYRDLDTTFSAERLFLAGIIPGVLTVALLGAYGLFVGRKEKLETHSFKLSHALHTLRIASLELLIPVVLIAVWMITSKLVDAAAATALYVVFIEVVVYRDINLRKDWFSIVEKSTMLVGAILIILASSSGFTGYLIQDQVPTKVLGVIEAAFGKNELLFLLSLNVFLLVVGMLMDVFTAIFVVAPLLIPIAVQFGINPYHLAIVFLLNLEIGYMTPPVGLNLFIASLRFRERVTVLYRSVLPFVAILGSVLILVTYVPSLSTWLADRVMGPEITHRDFGSTTPSDSLHQEQTDGFVPNHNNEKDESGSQQSEGLDDLEELFEQDAPEPGGLDALEAELEDEG